MLALIDADIVAYRCAASAEKEPLDIAILRADRLMRDILEKTKSSQYLAYISGANNFRKEIYPLYKANRDDVIKPVHLEAVKEFLVLDWKASVTDVIEADDELGIHQADNTVICSIDKDLLQIPGKHYNFVNDVHLTVDDLSGLRHFYAQMLMGDRADNIGGFDGVMRQKMPKFIQRIVEPWQNETEMIETVCQMYNDGDRFQTNADCLWILREEDITYSGKI